MHPDSGPVRAAGAPETVITIGGSAGAIGALLDLAAELPHGLAAAILVTTHRPASTPSALPKLLARAARRPCSHPRSGERLQSDHI